jgi:hypothetical protein
MSALPPVRRLKHTRSIVLEAYTRDDGLWEIEARLTDRKTETLQLATGAREAGEPIHEMLLRLTYNDQFEVVDAEASSLAVPYPGHCEAITPAYKRLIGLNLLKSFRGAVRERLGRTEGCTHMSELCAVLPTVAVQARASERHKLQPPTERPFQLDQCHALRTDGEAVRTYYPQWYQPSKTTDAAVPPDSDLPALKT